jgi:hypothetical protein
LYEDPLKRPHQLVLGGDQIYADDVWAGHLLLLNPLASAQSKFRVRNSCVTLVCEDLCDADAQGACASSPTPLMPCRSV